MNWQTNLAGLQTFSAISVGKACAPKNVWLHVNFNLRSLTGWPHFESQREPIFSLSHLRKHPSHHSSRTFLALQQLGRNDAVAILQQNKSDGPFGDDDEGMRGVVFCSFRALGFLLCRQPTSLSDRGKIHNFCFGKFVSAISNYCLFCYCFLHLVICSQ